MARKGSKKPVKSGRKARAKPAGARSAKKPAMAKAAKPRRAAPAAKPARKPAAKTGAKPAASSASKPAMPAPRRLRKASARRGGKPMRAPAPRHKSGSRGPIARGPYESDLDKTAANFQSLTPLTFLERAASVFPDRMAIVHGMQRITYAEFHERARRLASALAKHGVRKGDTVAVMLANTPPMLDAHYGVPMSGGVLNTLNTRLDAAALAFILDHGEAKVLIVDREFSKVVRDALALCKARPLIIDYDDPEYKGAGERLGTIEY